MRLVLALPLLIACASSGGSRSVADKWTVQAPKVERDGDRFVLSVVSEACHEDRKMACNTALNRARALLVAELRKMLDQIGSSGVDGAAEQREPWLQRAVTGAQPAEVWSSDGDDCSWLLARVDLSAMTEDAEAPVEAGRALQNHLQSIAPPAAAPAAGATCE
jgi:hypothetical protein